MKKKNVNLNKNVKFCCDHGEKKTSETTALKFANNIMFVSMLAREKKNYLVSFFRIK